MARTLTRLTGNGGSMTSSIFLNVENPFLLENKKRKNVLASKADTAVQLTLTNSLKSQHLLPAASLIVVLTV